MTEHCQKSKEEVALELLQIITGSTVKRGEKVRIVSECITHETSSTTVDVLTQLKQGDS